MDAKTIERLSKCHPRLRVLVTNLINNLATQGFDIRCVSGYRNEAEQTALYAQGRQSLDRVNSLRKFAGLPDLSPAENKYHVTNAAAGQSNHNFALAVDLCNFVDGKPQWEDNRAFTAIAREARRLGLETGADWRFLDKPHVQLKGMSVKDCQKYFRQGGIPAVWERMNELLAGAPATVFVPTANDLLEFGDKGAEIKALQEQLVKLNYLRPYEVDSEFGKITKNAVISFQRQHNLTADGIIGKGTRAVLLNEIAKMEEIKKTANQPAVIDAPVSANLIGANKGESGVVSGMDATPASPSENTGGDQPNQLNQTAENIINAPASASNETSAEEAKIVAAAAQPPVQIPAPEPTGFIDKVKNLVYGVATGSIALPFLDKVFGIQLTPEAIELLKTIFPFVFFGIIGALCVWFVVTKLNNYHLTKLIADKNADVTQRNVCIVPTQFNRSRSAYKAGLWRRAAYAITAKPAYIWMDDKPETQVSAETPAANQPAQNK